MSASLVTALAELERRLGASADPPIPLTGGITNHNYRVRIADDDLVLRLPGPDTELLGIDRQVELEATSAAGELGLGAEVVAYLEEHRCLVTRFVDASPCTEEDLRGPLLPVVGAMLRRVHAHVRVDGTFSAFSIVQAYADTARRRGMELPDDVATAAGIATRIEACLQGPEHAPVGCHNDLLCGNFLQTSAGLRLIDWEYAGMGDRYFDLANMATNNGLDDDDDARLLEAYFGSVTAARIAKLALMRVMSDFREAMWAVVQGSLSELDFDYAGYAAEHVARMREQMQRPELGTWLSVAERAGERASGVTRSPRRPAPSPARTGRPTGTS